MEPAALHRPASPWQIPRPARSYGAQACPVTRRLRPILTTAAAAAATDAAAPASPRRAHWAPLDIAAYDSEVYEVPRASQAPHLVPQGPWQEVAGGVCAPLGFAAQGLWTGQRASSHRADAALVASDRPAVSAGVISASSLAGASAAHTGQALDRCGQARAVLLTHGQATGQDGVKDAERACATVATLLGIPGSDAEQVLMQSAGAAAQRLRLDRLLPALPLLAARLAEGPEGAYHAASAVAGDLSTATMEAALEVPLGGHTSVRLGGLAHASPTGVQAVITCDAAVDGRAWREMFERAVAASFGQLALCGEEGCREDDSLVGLANGSAGGVMIFDAASGAGQRLEAALTALMQGLAKTVAWDGPAASCLLEVEVKGAESAQAAAEAARAVAHSQAVRSGVKHSRPDWAPVVDALGSSGVEFRLSDVAVSVGGMALFHHGQPTADLASACSYAAQVLHFANARRSTVTLGIRLGQGSGSAKAWTCGA